MKLPLTFCASLIGLIGLLSLKTQAQNGSAFVSTLANDGPVIERKKERGRGKFGGFGAALVEIGQIEPASRSLMVGVGGAATYNRRWFVGGFIQGFATYYNRQIPYNDGFAKAELSAGAGGLWLGGSCLPQKVAHPAFGLKIGAFFANWQRLVPDTYPQIYDKLQSDHGLLLQPEASLEINVARFARLNFFGGYRWVPGLELPEFASGSLDGFLGGFVVRIGSF